MGLYFFVGVCIYLLILATLMVWFINYHNNKGRKDAMPFKDSHGKNEETVKDESASKPNHYSTDIFQAGVQSRSEKSEVLPGYCGQPK